MVVLTGGNNNPDSQCGGGVWGYEVSLACPRHGVVDVPPWDRSGALCYVRTAVNPPGIPDNRHVVRPVGSSPGGRGQEVPWQVPRVPPVAVHPLSDALVPLNRQMVLPCGEADAELLHVLCGGAAGMQAGVGIDVNSEWGDRVAFYLRSSGGNQG